MVNEYNTACRNQGISGTEMFATVGDLIDVSDLNPAALSRPEFFNFDIAVVGLGFHHFGDPNLAATKLAERLRKGGVLMIVDFLPHEHHGHRHHHEQENTPPEGKYEVMNTVTHMGFSEDEVKKIFEVAGVGTGFEYVKIGKGIVFGGKGAGGSIERSVFMARGSKS